MKKIVLGKSEKNRKWQRKPVDLCHAIRLLDEILPQSAKIKLVKDRQRNLARWSLGLWLRNNWGLWEMSPWKLPRTGVKRFRFLSQNKLLKYFWRRGVLRPDDMSKKILDTYQNDLKGIDRPRKKSINFRRFYSLSIQSAKAEDLLDYLRKPAS